MPAGGGAARHLQLRWADGRWVSCRVSALLCISPEPLAQEHASVSEPVELHLQTAFLPLRHGIPSFVGSPLVSGYLIGWANQAPASQVLLKDLQGLEKLLRLCASPCRSSGAA